MPRQKGAVNWKTLAVIGLVIVAIWITIGRFSGDEGKIRKQIKAAEQAIENQDPFAFLMVFSKDYEDEKMIQFGVIFKLAQTAFGKYDDVDVDVSNVNIEIKGDSATVTLDIWGEATIASTKGKETMPVREGFQEKDSKIMFRKEGSKWLIISSKNIRMASAVR